MFLLPLRSLSKKKKNSKVPLTTPLDVSWGIQRPIQLRQPPVLLPPSQRRQRLLRTRSRLRQPPFQALLYRQ